MGDFWKNAIRVAARGGYSIGWIRFRLLAAELTANKCRRSTIWIKAIRIVAIKVGQPFQADKQQDVGLESLTYEE